MSLLLALQSGGEISVGINASTLSTIASVIVELSSSAAISAVTNATSTIILASSAQGSLNASTANAVSGITATLKNSVAVSSSTQNAIASVGVTLRLGVSLGAQTANSVASASLASRMQCGVSASTDATTSSTTAELKLRGLLVAGTDDTVSYIEIAVADPTQVTILAFTDDATASLSAFGVLEVTVSSTTTCTSNIDLDLWEIYEPEITLRISRLGGCTVDALPVPIPPKLQKVPAIEAPELHWRA